LNVTFKRSSRINVTLTRNGEPMSAAADVVGPIPLERHVQAL
jgi:hypothetical protein